MQKKARRSFIEKTGEYGEVPVCVISRMAKYFILLKMPKWLMVVTGVTTVDGTEGWMDLEKTEEWLKEHPEAQKESVDAEPVTEESSHAGVQQKMQSAQSRSRIQEWQQLRK